MWRKTCLDQFWGMCECNVDVGANHAMCECDAVQWCNAMLKLIDVRALSDALQFVVVLLHFAWLMMRIAELRLSFIFEAGPIPSNQNDGAPTGQCPNIQFVNSALAKLAILQRVLHHAMFEYISNMLFAPQFKSLKCAPFPMVWLQS